MEMEMEGDEARLHSGVDGRLERRGDGAERKVYSRE